MENKRNQFSVRSPSRVPYRTKLLPRAPNGGVPGPPSHGEGRRTIISGVVKENEMSWISSPPHPRARADEAAVSTRSISACLRQYIHVLSESTSTNSPRVLSILRSLTHDMYPPPHMTSSYDMHVLSCSCRRTKLPYLGAMV